MPAFSLKNKSLLVTALSIAISACGGSSGGGGGPEVSPNPEPLTPTTSLELLDPTPGAGDKFGSQVLQLPNGNIVVTDSGDSSVVEKNGAVHLYSPRSATPISSVYGDNGNDQIGRRIALVGDNYVIASPNDTVDGIANAGSVRLMHGRTGEQLAIVTGKTANAFLGSGGITQLTNGHLVVASPSTAVGNLSGVGSVQLLNGVTGEPIGEPLTGVAENDVFGSDVYALPNNNYVIVSSSASNGALEDVGSVVLVDGETGRQIGTTLFGDQENDRLGRKKLAILKNGNYVITSPDDNLGDISRAGSVRLFNAITGEQIGSTFYGDQTDDLIGSNGTFTLDNGNYVVASANDNEKGVSYAGSVRLFDGETGAAIGSPIVGDANNDQIGGDITVLPGGNYVIASASDNENGLEDVGSVRLINGETGQPIGQPLAGDNIGDSLGSRGVRVLNNGNYVVASHLDDENSVTDSGSVRLINGRTGEQIGEAFVGDNQDDRIGFTGVAAFSNNNYLVSSQTDTVNGVTFAGSVQLFNGATGETIGTLKAGESATDQLGRSGIVELNSGNYVVISFFDNENGIEDAGSVRLFSATSGEQIGDAIVGEAQFDMFIAVAQQGVGGDYYILSQNGADKGGLEDSGRVRIVVPE
ncbi:hypothetical protein [Bacterioplanoides sp.]|uniref:hypothetical protein n=1 Tax=Bacterioplanoides sp. TaxID=2066072 RepID=UPI003B00370B